MGVISFFVAGVPQTKGSWKVAMRQGRPRLIPDNETEPAWAAAVAWAAKLELAKHRHEADRRPYSVTMDFTLPAIVGRGRKNRRDVDKLIRSCLDALTGLVWLDDEQVNDVSASKVVGYRAGVDISISI